MVLLLKKLFNETVSTQVTEQKNLFLLRHGLMATFAFSLTLWINTLFDIPQFVYSFFAAVLFVFFDMAPTLWQRLADIVIFSPLIALMCLFSAVVNASAYLATLYFMIAATFLYTIGNYHPKLLLFAVFSLYMISFSSGIGMDVSWYDGVHRFIAMMIGTASALVSVVLFSPLPRGDYLPVALKHWLNDWTSTLNLPIQDQLSRVSTLNHESQLLVDQAKIVYPELSILIHDLFIDWQKLLNRLNQQEFLFFQAHLEKEVKKFFEHIQISIKKQDKNLLPEAYQDIVKTVLSLREQHIVQILPSEERINLAYMLVFMKKITVTLEDLLSQRRVRRWIS